MKQVRGTGNRFSKIRKEIQNILSKFHQFVLNLQSKEKNMQARSFLHQWNNKKNTALIYGTNLEEGKEKGNKEVAEVLSTNNNNKPILQNTSPKNICFHNFLVLYTFLYVSFVVGFFFFSFYGKQRHKFGTQINQSSEEKEQ